MIANLRDSLKAGRSDEVGRLLKDIHDAARALRTEIDLPAEFDLGRQLASARAEVAELLKARSTIFPARCAACCVRAQGAATRPRRSMPSTSTTSRRSSCWPRPAATMRASSRSARRRAASIPICRTISTTARDVLLDRLRAVAARRARFRQSQVDAAVRFCAKLFGAEYASTLAKAADVAAKGEQKAAKA